MSRTPPRRSRSLSRLRTCAPSGDGIPRSRARRLRQQRPGRCTGGRWRAPTRTADMAMTHLLNSPARLRRSTTTSGALCPAAATQRKRFSEADVDSHRRRWGSSVRRAAPHRPRDDRPADRRMSMPMHRMGSRETLAQLPFFGAERFGERPAQRFKPGTAWQDLTYAGLLDVIRELALGIVALGVRPGDRVCVLSDTRPEWVQAEFGIAAAGAIVVPIYPSSSPEECEWVIGDSGAVAVICENAAQLAKVEQVRRRLPELRDVIVVDPVGAQTASLQQLRARGREGDRSELERRVAGVRADDPALVIYTSGTTGRPKGCVLTHRNMTACSRITEELRVI